MERRWGNTDISAELTEEKLNKLGNCAFTKHKKLHEK